jgi:Recombinase
VVADGGPLSKTQDARGHLTPDNVRLAHKFCNQRDYIWRKKINVLLGKRMSLEEIAEKLNAEKVPTIHGTNRWTASSVRKAFVSRTATRCWASGTPPGQHADLSLQSAP